MRIHHIINDYNFSSGGAQRLVRVMHTGLRERGIESNILGLAVHQSNETIAGAQTLGLRSSYSLRAWNGIRRYLKKHVKPGDIIHAHLFPASLYLSVLKILGVIKEPMLFTEHSTSNRRRGTIFGRILDALTYAGYDQVVAISRGAEESLLKWKPSLRGKTRVIYNGVHFSFEEVIQRPVKEKLRVVSLGNLRPPKNYPNALKAIALLPDLDFEYLIAGDGKEAQELKVLCHELGLDSRVRFLGYVQNIHALLQKGDVFLMPSLWEGFGMAAVEAMNASLPSVVSDVPGLREVVHSDPPCALLVDPHSPPAIAEGLRQLLSSPDLRQKMGKNAFHWAQNFNQERMLEEHLDLYAELIQS